MSENRMEIIWGTAILDEGFTSYPNLLIKSYRKLGIEHGEMMLILTILTYKHDHRDPYPSIQRLAEDMCVSDKQIKKWLKSLREKGFIITGQYINDDGTFGSNTYVIKPLIDACLKLTGEDPLPESKQRKIRWITPEEPQVPTVTERTSGTHGKRTSGTHGVEPQVPPKKKNIKIKKENENISQSVSKSKIKSEAIQIAIAKNKKLTDRLTDIISVYEVIRDEPEYSDALFIVTLQKAIKAKINVPFAQYLLKAMINNLSEQQSKPTKDKPSKQKDALPDYVKKQLTQDHQKFAVTEELDKEKKREALNLLLQLKEIDQKEYERRWNAL